MKKITLFVLALLMVFSMMAPISVRASEIESYWGDDGAEEWRFRTITIEEMEAMNELPVFLSFDDVSRGDWFYDNLRYAYMMNIINGKSERKFAPNDTLTWAEALKITAICHWLLNYNDEDLTPYGKDWYTVYVEYCRKMEIIPKDLQFDPNKAATRAELAMMFAGIEVGANVFLINDVPITDIPDVNMNTKYVDEILQLYNMGVMVGSDANYTFYPNQTIKRSEVTALISRILNYNYRIELAKG